MFLFCVCTGRAETVLGEWVPQFKGVDLSISTNTPGGGGFRNLQVVHALRVDLTDPDIRLLTTPPLPDQISRSGEVGGLTVSAFLVTNQLQAAINASFFSPGSYYLPAGTPMDIEGLSVSEGVVVSPADDPGHAATILFDRNNHPTVIPRNWPAGSLDGVYTAISGDFPLVVGGTNLISPASRGSEPRTVFGISEDRRYLYLVAIDGRQDGYSEGASDYESAEWLRLLGAHEGINVDGGGSTTLVMEDSTGVPIRINRSSAVADSGRERTVGSHLGIYAKPLPGFINDVVSTAQDTSTTIRWTTVQPASGAIQFGTTPDFGLATEPIQDPSTDHLVQLTELSPNTGYYFRVLSSVGDEQHVSRTFYFRTEWFVTTNRVVDVSHEWRYAPGTAGGLEWTRPEYEDSAWGGPGPGLLWVDVRAAGPNEEVAPRNAEIPADPATGYPYTSYFFRTHFTLEKVLPGGALSVTGYFDDGAIIYLNGREIYRLRMPAESTPASLATGFPCDGDANCADQFMIQGEGLDALREGDNVLAVAVHNYNARSADITFGLALDLLQPVARNAALAVEQLSKGVTLRWSEPGFILQSAGSPGGPWSDVAAQSPYVVPTSEPQQYFRLKK